MGNRGEKSIRVFCIFRTEVGFVQLYTGGEILYEKKIIERQHRR
jgi:hypothetical protein